MKEEGRKKLKERGTEEQEESIYFCLFFLSQGPLIRD